MTKFCKDCKHMRDNGAACEAPQNYVKHTNTAKFLVTGEEQPTIRTVLGASCTVCRQYEVHPGLHVPMCGTAGNWFAPRD
jgi:hypothetical protein